MLITLVCFCYPTGCPENFHFNNNSGTLGSPRPYGSLLYPDNVRCEWSITIPENYQHVKLSFSTFELEKCPQCSCDYVEVFDLIETKKISLGKFCGSVLPGPFFSTKQTLSVVFKSDHGTSSIGFRASYTGVLPGAGEFMHLSMLIRWKVGGGRGGGVQTVRHCSPAETCEMLYSNVSFLGICGWS